MVSALEEKLFAFYYDNEVDNELRRLLKQWNDNAYFYQFVTEFERDAPSHPFFRSLISQIVESANDIDFILKEIADNRSKSLEDFL